jgi:hypothetical protein
MRSSVYILSLCLIWFNASASHTSSVMDKKPLRPTIKKSDDEKHFSLGISHYRETIATSDSDVEDNVFSGTALTISYSFSDHMRISSSIFKTEHEDNSSWKSDGYDILLHFGTGLATKGFKAYGGFGLFKDKWTLSSFSESRSGIQGGGGIGYNWENISIELTINLRQVSEYEEFIERTNSSGVGFVGSEAISMSFRF